MGTNVSPRAFLLTARILTRAQSRKPPSPRRPGLSDEGLLACWIKTISLPLPLPLYPWAIVVIVFGGCPMGTRVSLDKLARRGTCRVSPPRSIHHHHHHYYYHYHPPTLKLKLGMSHTPPKGDPNGQLFIHKLTIHPSAAELDGSGADEWMREPAASAIAPSRRNSTLPAGMTHGLGKLGPGGLQELGGELRGSKAALSASQHRLGGGGARRPSRSHLHASASGLQSTTDASTTGHGASNSKATSPLGRMMGISMEEALPEASSGGFRGPGQPETETQVPSLLPDVGAAAPRTPTTLGG